MDLSVGCRFREFGKFSIITGDEGEDGVLIIMDDDVGRQEEELEDEEEDKDAEDEDDELVIRGGGGGRGIKFKFTLETVVLRMMCGGGEDCGYEVRIELGA
jgi:hypothetical protein